MGTRNLIAIYKDGEYKVAKYCQWDGYPSGQGIGILRFLRDKMDREQFEEKLKLVRYIPDEEAEKLYNENSSNFENLYPALCRNMGSEIFNFIKNSEEEILTNNYIDFAGDSLFCEFAYVVDFDNNTFEVFEGFNKTPLDDNERFYSFKGKGEGNVEYEPVSLSQKFDLNNLPTDEEFLNLLEEKEEDEEKDEEKEE